LFPGSNTPASILVISASRSARRDGGLLFLAQYVLGGDRQALTRKGAADRHDPNRYR
jgi:hypothetical protein